MLWKMNYVDFCLVYLGNAFNETISYSRHIDFSGQSLKCSMESMVLFKKLFRNGLHRTRHIY